MKRQCIQCKKVFGESGDLSNGSVTGSICLNCMIEYLERRINFLKIKEQTPITVNSLQRNKKRLTLMLITRQEKVGIYSI